MSSQHDPKETFANILIAEDNEVSREMVAGILHAKGYKTLYAANGDEAIALLGEEDIDLALVDINMSPTGGFEFVKYMLVKGFDVPVVIITSDDTSDMLIEASALGVQRVLQKPIQPQKLLDTVQKILKRRGINPQPMGIESYDTRHSAEALMKRAVELADKNAKSKRGGPFGAVVADGEGRILGEGVNGITSRSDPTAHAEVMAIRQAAEKLGRSDLSDCVLYVSSEPTMMGKALILSVAIPEVYYGLSHQDVKEIRMREETVRAELAKADQVETRYKQLCREDAQAMFESWKTLRNKIAD